MTWQPMIEKIYQDGVLVSATIQRTPNGPKQPYQDEALAQPEQEPVGINGLTEAETNATASVFGLVNTTPPQRKPLTDEQAVWSLNVDELAIYRDGKRFVELDEEGSNDSWREALCAGSEIVRLLNAAPQPSKPHPDCDSACIYVCTEGGKRAPKCEVRKPLTDEEISKLAICGVFHGDAKAITRAIESSHGIKE